MFGIEPLTLAFDLFLICSGLGVVAWMIHEYRQACANGYPEHSAAVTTSPDQKIVPLATCERPCESHRAQGELRYLELARSRARRAARPATARSARAGAGRASALRFEHRG